MTTSGIPNNSAKYPRILYLYGNGGIWIPAQFPNLLNNALWVVYLTQKKWRLQTQTALDWSTLCWLCYRSVV